MGFVILGGLAQTHRSLELRRIVIKEKGKGYGKQTLIQLKRYCFEVLGFHRFWLDVFENNLVAMALYKAQGFKEEGMERESVRSGNDFRSLRIFSILEQEYLCLDTPV